MLEPMPNVFPALVLCSAAALTCAAPSAGSRNESVLEREVPPLDLESLLRAHPERFGDVLERADEHRLKIELAVVDDSGDAPRLARSSLDFGPEYFYPASSVKTCAVVTALMDVRLLEEVAMGTHVLDPRDDAGVTRDAALRYLPLFDGEEVYDRDPSHLAGGTVTIAHDVAKVLLVSDNPAYNRLFEFSGPDRIREVMRGAGLASTRIVHRMSEFRSPEEQLRLPAIDVLGQDGEALVRIPERMESAPDDNAHLSGIVFGRAHVSGSTRREGPMDFTRKNYMSLEDLMLMNVAILAPDVEVPGCAPFELHSDDRALVEERMASTPSASEDPRYDGDKYSDDYSKFLAPGLWKLRAKDEIEIRDKVGRAYGFSITNSAVVDRVTGRRFFLAATLYTNANDVVGDGVYEYERADRFMADLGEVVGRAVLGE